MPAPPPSHVPMLSHSPLETRSPSHPAAALSKPSRPAGSTGLSPPPLTSNFCRRLYLCTWPSLNSSSRWVSPYKRWLSGWGPIRLARPIARNFRTDWLISWEPDGPTRVWTRPSYKSYWSRAVAAGVMRLQLWIKGHHFRLTDHFIGR
ncbi:hypothetical protein LINGRAHAP2_LOCUS29417 [Linum grandiflorum]